MLLRLIIEIAFVATVSNSKPIAVSFGTNEGPIVPPTPSTTTLNPLAPKTPAPVYEKVDDVPPPQYKPPTPNQYRNSISWYKPNTDSQLGTPLDVKYQHLNTVNELKIQQQKAEIAEQEGLGYRGAQAFNVQEYEFENARNQQQGLQPAKKLTNAQQFVEQYVVKQQRNDNDTQEAILEHQAQARNAYRFSEGHHGEEEAINQYANQFNGNAYQNHPQNAGNYQFNNNDQYVPAIGIVYSSGLRYYVPQIYYYDSRQQQQRQQQQQERHQGYNELRDNGIYRHENES